MKINKKKSICILIISLIIILIISVAVFGLINSKKLYRKELNNNEKRILVESAYENNAWGFQYNGTAIFNDGTIYDWDFSGSGNDSVNTNNKEELEEWILEHGRKINKKVKAEDLKKIENLIKNLDGTFERKFGNVYDFGSYYISVWNSNNKEIKLTESGDYIGENKTDNSQKLINIIRQIFKSID